jgi:hypothetical protein
MLLELHSQFARINSLPASESFFDPGNGVKERRVIDS